MRHDFLQNYFRHSLFLLLCFLQRSDAINIIQKFSICQDEDVWTQLLFGVRYLDLRVSYYPESPEKFWIVHDFVRLNPLHEVVSDVRRFMSVTKEMVILDFHRFPQGSFEVISSNYSNDLPHFRI